MIRKQSLTLSRVPGFLLTSNPVSYTHLMKIIKAISVSTAGDIQKYKEYVGAVDYFLFDTICKTVGGSGQKFDWQVLNEYDGDVPFPVSYTHLKEFLHCLCSSFMIICIYLFV